MSPDNYTYSQVHNINSSVKCEGGSIGDRTQCGAAQMLSKGPTTEATSPAIILMIFEAGSLRPGWQGTHAVIHNRLPLKVTLYLGLLGAGITVNNHQTEFPQIIFKSL